MFRGENLDTESLGFDKSPSLYVNQALFNAERVYGVCLKMNLELGI